MFTDPLGSSSAALPPSTSSRTPAKPPHRRRCSPLLCLAAAVAGSIALPAHAAIPDTYTGPNNSDWNTNTNWSAGVVPVNGANTYDVTVNNISGLTFDLPGGNAINSLDLTGSSLSLNAGDNLSVVGAAVLTNASITANGDFTASDATGIDGVNLFANSSGGISIGNVTSLTTANANVNEFIAGNGAGTLINLSSLTSINLAGQATLFVQAENGAVTDLSSLATVTQTGTRTVSFDAIGVNAVLKINAMGASGFNGDTVDVESGGTLQWGAPTTFTNSSLFIVGSATIDTSHLSDIDGSNIFVANAGAVGGSVSLPALTSFTAANANVNEAFQSSGAGSALNLSSLTTINLAGQATLFVQAMAGADLNLNGLATINHTGTRGLFFQATGAGSTLDLAALGAAGMNAIRVDVENGGSVLWGAPTTFTNSELDVAGAATINTSALSNINASVLVVSNFNATAGSLSLPALTSYTTVNANVNQQLEASGAGSLLNLGSLTTITLAGQATLFVQAMSGATVDLSALTTINHPDARGIDFQVYGPGSTLKIPGLVGALDAIHVDVETGGTVLWGAPTAFTNSELDVAGAATINTSALTSINASNIFVSNANSVGGSVSFPLLTSYTTVNVNANQVLQATGASSLLSLASLTTINLAGQATLFVQATGGGTVDLSALATINHPGTRVIDFQVYNPGSTLKIAALGAAGMDSVHIDVETGGSVLWGAPTTFTNSELDVSGAATINTSALSDIDGSNLFISTNNAVAASVSFPALTTYTAANANVNQQLQASGAGSLLSLTSLTTLNLAGQATLFLQALNGGTLDLSSLTTINHPGTRALTFQDFGAGSILKITALGNAGIDNVNLDIESGATLQWGNAAHVTNSNLTLSFPVSVDASHITNFDGSNAFLRNGATLALPLLSAYTTANTGSNPTLQSSDAGTSLSLPTLTTLHLPGNGVLSIQADSGGTVSMPAFTTFDAAGGSRTVNFRSYDPGSQLVLTALRSLPSDNYSLDLRDHGSILMGAFSDPFTLHFRANFSNALGDLDVFYNGALIADIVPNNLNTWETYDYSLTDPGLPFGSNPNITFNIAGNNAAAFVDEYQATEIPTPEPATLAILSLTAFPLLTRKRRNLR